MAKTWEELRAYRKAYYKKNKAKILKQVRAYREDNIKVIRVRDKKRYRVLADKATAVGISMSSRDKKAKKALKVFRRAARAKAQEDKQATHLTPTDYARTQQRSDYGRWKMYRSNARQQDRVWALTRTEFDVLINTPCHYHGGPEASRGVDRVDSLVGYVAGNVVPCCGTCNRMKNAFTQELFLERCRTIAQRFPAP